MSYVALIFDRESHHTYSYHTAADDQQLSHLGFQEDHDISLSMKNAQANHFFHDSLLLHGSNRDYFHEMLHELVDFKMSYLYQMGLDFHFPDEELELASMSSYPHLYLHFLDTADGQGGAIFSVHDGDHYKKFDCDEWTYKETRSVASYGYLSSDFYKKYTYFMRIQRFSSRKPLLQEFFARFGYMLFNSYYELQCEHDHF